MDAAFRVGYTYGIYKKNYDTTTNTSSLKVRLIPMKNFICYLFSKVLLYKEHLL